MIIQRNAADRGVFDDLNTELAGTAGKRLGQVRRIYVSIGRYVDTAIDARCTHRGTQFSDLRG